MNEAMILTAPAAMTSPRPGTPMLPLRGDAVVLTSDGFNGPAGELIGRVSDATQGGAPMEWKNNTSHPILLVNGAGQAAANVNQTTGTFYYHHDIEGGAGREVEVGVRVAKMFNVNVFIDLFRSITPMDRKMRTALKASGMGEVNYTAPSGQGTELVPGATFTYSVGDRIRFRYNTKTGRTRVWVNDVSVVDVASYMPPTPLDGQKFGVAGTPATTGAFDDFTLTETVL